jgi:hypothetical protein
MPQWLIEESSMEAQLFSNGTPSVLPDAYSTGGGLQIDMMRIMRSHMTVNL